MQKTKNNKGFSLVELIVVILIIAIIGVALTPNIMKWVKKAQASNEVQNYNSIVSALGTEVVELAKLSSTVYIAMDKDGTYITDNAYAKRADAALTDDDKIVKAALNSVLPGWAELKATGDNVYKMTVTNNGVTKVTAPTGE